MYLVSYLFVCCVKIPLETLPPGDPSGGVVWISILILSSHLSVGLPSGLFSSGSPTKILYVTVISLLSLAPHSSWFDHPNCGWWVLYQSCSCSLCSFFQFPVTSSFLVPNIFLVCLFWRNSPQWAMAYSFMRFLDHTQRHATLGRTPLDEWSARGRDLYLTAHNTHSRKTSMPPVGFEPTISAGERPQTYTLDRAATGHQHRQISSITPTFLTHSANVNSSLWKSSFTPQ